MGETIQIALPAVALVVLANIILTVMNRRAINNGGVTGVIRETREGQKLCHDVLGDIKASGAVQIELLRDIRDTLKTIASSR